MEIVIEFFIALILGILILGLIIFVLSILLSILFDLDFDDILDFLKNWINKFDTKITIGSKWVDGKYEIVDIKLEYPETDSEILKEYRTEKDKITVIYVRENNNEKSIKKYEISEFKKWFRK